MELWWFWTCRSPVFFLWMDFFVAKGGLSSRFHPFLKPPNSFCFASKSYQYSSKLPWFHLTPRILPGGSSVSPLLAADSRCRTGRVPPASVLIQMICTARGFIDRASPGSNGGPAVWVCVASCWQACACVPVCVSLYVSKHPQTGLLPFISGLCSKTWHRFTCDLSHMLLFVRSHLSQGLALVHLNPPWPVNKLIVT